MHCTACGVSVDADLWRSCPDCGGHVVDRTVIIDVRPGSEEFPVEWAIPSMARTSIAS